MTGLTRLALTAATALVLVGMAAPPAAAQWLPGGVDLCGGLCRGGNQLIAGDGQGGVFVCWEDRRNSSSADVYAQYVTAEGQVAWPLGGIPVAAEIRSQVPTAIEPDGLGGVYIAWFDDRQLILPGGGTSRDIYVQHLLPNGSIAPGWAVNGLPASRAPDEQEGATLATDGNGGVYVLWRDWRDRLAPNAADVYAQHFRYDGTLAPGWPADGLSLTSAPGVQSVTGFRWALPDGEGGLLAPFFDGSSPNPNKDMFATRVRPDGTFAPGWVHGGQLVLENRAGRSVAVDGAGGFLILGATVRDFFDREIYVRRFLFDGTPAAGWPPGGVAMFPVALGTARQFVQGDGGGGALVAWQGSQPGRPYGVFATRRLGDGTLAPSWTPNGTLLSEPGARANQFAAGLAGDGAGGAYVLWESESWDNSINTARIHHFLADGSLAPGWPEFGRVVAPGSPTSQFDSHLTPDGVGGAVVVWEERASSLGRSGFFAQRIYADSPTPALLSLAQAEATSERVRLVWQGVGAGALDAVVERSTEAIPWEAIGHAVRENADELSYEDRAMTPGARYAYRLRYTDARGEQVTAAAWVDVPARLELALAGFRPNPSLAIPVVAFTLPVADAARLEVFDVAGRRVVMREVGALGPGRHTLRLDDARLSAGVYVVRLVTASRTLLTRGVVAH
ncbi:MAG: T9SS type A sorting domain-containing protein [Candidatus Eisenbacteria bacterium]|uniref:T9SS type A sorting domain-containing protein n=1 Tax=Eiseniibacteriota bacterium TaxID=2212470 RepID=A0A849SQP4_UNCEI|nr:T9SS type A sorting domain-containing protein [Candidatus Eisenbacteria bacterium]